MDEVSQSVSKEAPMCKGQAFRGQPDLTVGLLAQARTVNVVVVGPVVWWPCHLQGTWAGLCLGHICVLIVCV
jgi:hypothetical protein